MTPVLFGEIAPLAAPILTHTPFDGVIAAPQLGAVLYALLIGALIGSFLGILREATVAGPARPKRKKMVAHREPVPVPHAA